MILFEHPTTEKVRNMLRVEYLFQRFEEAVVKTDLCAHYNALLALFELMDCASRAEFKLDLLQELERQRKIAIQCKHTELAEKLEYTGQELQGIHQKFAQHLRENEWLMGLKQKILVPGGMSPLDAPSYYFWQQQSFDERYEQLQTWVKSLWPTYTAIRMLLEILRANHVNTDCMAKSGNYQQQTLGPKVILLQIYLRMDLNVLPEVSANKYLTHIRFIEADFQHNRGKQVDFDVPFTLNVCSFNAGE